MIRCRGSIVSGFGVFREVERAMMVITIECPKGLANSLTGLRRKQSETNIIVVVILEPDKCLNWFIVPNFNLHETCLVDFDEVAVRDINDSALDPFAALRAQTLGGRMAGVLDRDGAEPGSNGTNGKP
jgi:hypothetical protein